MVSIFFLSNLIALAIYLYIHPFRFFNDVEIKNSSKYKIETKENVYSLTVNKCDHPDVGVYRVHVDNGIDHTDQTSKLNVGGMSSLFAFSPSLLIVTLSLSLSSSVKPKVEAPKPANEQSCVIGQDTQITWKFSGIEKPQVTWLFNGQPLATDNPRYTITHNDEDGSSTLAIHASELTDKGVYTARATNAVGEVEAKTTLNIAGIKPTITTDLDANLQAIKDESMTIKVNVTGTPRPDVIWMKGNDELVPNEHYHINLPAAPVEGETSTDETLYTLTIVNVQPDDQGEYSAKINNVGGSLKTKKCKLSVMSKSIINFCFTENERKKERKR